MISDNLSDNEAERPKIHIRDTYSEAPILIGAPEQRITYVCFSNSQNSTESEIHGLDGSGQVRNASGKETTD